jgi:GNAT superfamily N-acetyltransferase
MPAATGWVIRDKTAADQPFVESLLRQRWGSTLVAAHGELIDAATLPALVAGEREGLATWRVDDDAELVTLDALVPTRGIGTALVADLARRLRHAGIGALRVTTTNDNLDALRFYQRRGFRIAALRAGAVDAARRQKASIPETGAYGIPIRDEIELRLDLAGHAT